MLLSVMITILLYESLCVLSVIVIYIIIIIIIILLLLLLLLLLFNVITITSCQRSTNLSVEDIFVDVTLQEVIERPSDGFEHVFQLSRQFVHLFAHQHAP